MLAQRSVWRSSVITLSGSESLWKETCNKNVAYPFTKNSMQFHITRMYGYIAWFNSDGASCVFYKFFLLRCFRICYSFHPSLCEIRDTILYLKPGRAFGNVVSPENKREVRAICSKSIFCISRWNCFWLYCVICAIRKNFVLLIFFVIRSRKDCTTLWSLRGGRFPRNRLTKLVLWGSLSWEGSESYQVSSRSSLC